MFYPDEIIEDVRAQNDIVEIISSVVTLKKRGASYFGLCPFHNEKSPSFSVHPEKQIYHCFGCGAAGNVITFVMEYESATFVETIKSLAERASIVLPNTNYSEKSKKELEKRNDLIEMHTEAAKYFHANLHSSSGKIALSYLHNRNFGTGILNKFGVGYSFHEYDQLFKLLLSKGYSEELILASGLCGKNAKGNVYDRFRNRIMFPIINTTGKVIAFGGRIIDSQKKEAKYLNSPETPVFSKSKNLYGLNFAKKHKGEELILVEGYLDVLAMFSAGYTNTVATLGTAFNTEHANTLKNYTNKVLIFFDSDDAGKKAVLRSLEVLNAKSFNTRVFHHGTLKDPDDCINNLPLEKFNSMLANADSSILYLIKEIKNDFDLEIPSEKIEALKKIANLLKTIESPIELDIYVKETEKLMSVSANSIFEELKTIDLHSDMLNSKFKISSKTRKTEYLLRKDLNDSILCILALISVNPLIYLKIKPVLKPEMYIDETYIMLAKILYDYLDKNKNFSLAQFISYFEDPSLQQLATQVFDKELHFDDLERALNDSVKILLKENNMIQMNELAEKKVYTDEDRITLSNLGKEFSALEMFHIPLGDA